MVLFSVWSSPKLRFVADAAAEVSLALSSVRASQNALCVMKLSFLFDSQKQNQKNKNELPYHLLPNHISYRCINFESKNEHLILSLY